MTKKIDRLRRQLAEAEQAVMASSKPYGTPMRHNAESIADRDKIAGKLQAAIDRSNSPAPWFNPWVTLAIVVSLFLLAWIAGR